MKLKNELLYGGLEKRQYLQIKEPVKKDNQKALVVMCGCISLFWVMSLILSLKYSNFTLCRWVYAIALIVGIIIVICDIILPKYVPWITYPLVFLFKMTLLIAGVGIAIAQNDTKTITMFVMPIILPSCFCTPTIESIITNTTAFIVYVITAKGIIVPDIYTWGLSNGIIFSTAGVLVGHFNSKARYQRFLYAESAQKLADLQTRYAYFDQLTSLKNRRAYEEQIAEFSTNKPLELCVIMLDVNDLKVINDTLGHIAGDELLTGTSECIKQAFSDTDMIYRIGGDEFCVLLTQNTKNVNSKLNKL